MDAKAGDSNDGELMNVSLNSPGEGDLASRLGDQRPLLIGVVHLRPLPGSPGAAGRLPGDAMTEALKSAEIDARALLQGGADGIVVENFGDAPFFASAVPPETVAAMAIALKSVMAAAPGLPVGVNVMRNDARSALGLCAATGASFLRVNVHVGAMVTDQGVLTGQAAETLRSRVALVPGALLLADVHVKHAAPIAPRPIGESALETIERGLADFVIVSGSGTGSEPDIEELRQVAQAVGRPKVLIGSGLTEANAASLMTHARGAIVGTSIKEGGRLEAPVDATRVRRLKELLMSL